MFDCFEDSLSRSELETRLVQVQPKEILMASNTSKHTEKMINAILVGGSFRIETVDDSKFNYQNANMVSPQLSNASLGFPFSTNRILFLKSF